jgi:hypothetical protein
MHVLAHYKPLPAKRRARPERPWWRSGPKVDAVMADAMLHMRFTSVYRRK